MILNNKLNYAISYVNYNETTFVGITSISYILPFIVLSQGDNDTADIYVRVVWMGT